MKSEPAKAVRTSTHLLVLSLSQEDGQGGRLGGHVVDQEAEDAALGGDIEELGERGAGEMLVRPDAVVGKAFGDADQPDGRDHQGQARAGRQHDLARSSRRSRPGWTDEEWPKPAPPGAGRAPSNSNVSQRMKTNTPKSAATLPSSKR